ncbi:MAG: GNAT family N-acetyltransferase [Bacteroidales bacterium]|jgi:diamine N-acetyltransferase|nr:GNAT family N-acetyltransferase [Bacteroidales bacterium]
MKYEDIRLRALEPEDLELLYEWENDSDNWVISNTITPFSRFTLKRYLEDAHRSIYETGQLRLMIAVNETRETIGTIDLFDFDPFHRRAGIGILIADEKFRRKGYASMALTCLTNYCFRTLHLHQIYCSIIATNTESMELFRKQGFVETGIKKDWICNSDGFYDEHMFQMINPIRHD